MSENLATLVPLSIAALPSSTARQIGSGQVLVDPSSVIKELIDNALDARAKSIFVDITANTIDSIQVKDDGHGVPAEDRPLLCRRHCTSKIRDFQDLREVGAKWLGFRGEALSSISETSGSLSVTTRVEGEPVAVRLKYGQNGELVSTERDSHPVGTTVKAIRLFEFLPVRKHTAIKNSAKCLLKTRRLIQAYALARPAVRFRLHVIKAKNTKDDFVYAPKATAALHDATLKVIGKDCGSQCEWTHLKADGYELHAILPRFAAIGIKIANSGAFISVDARPMSSDRGIIKQIVAMVRDRLRKLNSSMTGVRDPFFCINIKCPSDSYDPNIEPAKDMIMFDNEALVLGVIEKLLDVYYPKAITEGNGGEPADSVQSNHPYSSQRLEESNTTPVTDVDSASVDVAEHGPLRPTHNEPIWRSSMYGIDEDDLESLEVDQNPIVEEEKAGVVEVSNPWTTARMNAKVNPRNSALNGQLMSPAKSDCQVLSSSPHLVKMPIRSLSTRPLTPETQIDGQVATSTLEPWASSDGGYLSRFSMSNAAAGSSQNDGVAISHHMPIMESRPCVSYLASRSSPMQERRQSTAAQDVEEGPGAAWFERPTRSARSTQGRRHQDNRRSKPEVPLFPVTEKSPSKSRNRPAAPAPAETRLISENNTDIRDFFRQARPPQKTNSDTLDSALPVARDHSMHPAFSQYLKDRFDASKGYAMRQQESSSTFSVDDASSAELLAHSSGPPIHAALYNDVVSYAMAPNSSRSTHDMTSADMSQPLLVRREQQATLPQLPFRFDEASNIQTTQQQRNKPKKVHDLFSRYNIEDDYPIRPHNNCTSRRRHSTARSQRTTSSSLPLNHTPHGHRTQNVVLSLSLGVATLIQSAQKLDMRRNSVRWGSQPGDLSSVFHDPATETRIVLWVVQLDEALHSKYGRVSEVDTCCLLHEGIQQGLGDMQYRRKTKGPDTELSGTRSCDTSAEQCGESVGATQGQNPQGMAGFDVSQYIDSDGNGFNDETDSTIPKVTMDSDSLEEVGDDMLLEL